MISRQLRVQSFLQFSKLMKNATEVLDQKKISLDILISEMCHRYNLLVMEPRVEHI